MLRRIVRWQGEGCSPWTRDPGTASGTDASPGHVCQLWTGSLSCYQPWCPAPARMTKNNWLYFYSFILWYYDAFSSQIFKVPRHHSRIHCSNVICILLHNTVVTRVTWRINFLRNPERKSEIVDNSDNSSRERFVQYKKDKWFLNF